jgi:hypothetical protein
LKGATGRVARRRHGDAAAWVKMDAALPEKLRRFSDDDPRATHVLLFPDECERAT